MWSSCRAKPGLLGRASATARSNRNLGTINILESRLVSLGSTSSFSACDIGPPAKSLTRLILRFFVFDHRPPLGLRDVEDDVNDPERIRGDLQGL